ncbi:MAG: hypothetical protein VX589_01420 [Myxococcota bacterium]|nr:hypothetical protein [Myxococcota bacterium]
MIGIPLSSLSMVCGVGKGPWSYGEYQRWSDGFLRVITRLEYPTGGLTAYHRSTQQKISRSLIHMSDWFPDPPIYAACQQKDENRLRVVRALLAEGADPNAPDYRGYPPLASWAVRGDLELIDLLIEGGASPNALSRANHILGEMVRDFPAQRTPEDRDRLRAIIERMLTAGADPNLYVQNIEHSPLWLAIKWSWTDIIPVLLDAGADAARTDEDGVDALEWAIRCEDLASVHALGGSDAVARAMPRIPDPVCERIFQALVARLKSESIKLKLEGPGFKYEYVVFYEYYWQDGHWIQATFDEYAHQTPIKAAISTLGDDDESLRARLIDTERINETVNKPRARGWRRLLEQALQKRTDEDFIVQVRQT